MTTVRIQTIDPSAPGSHHALKERRALIAARNKAVAAYNDAVEAFNNQRDVMGYNLQPVLEAQIAVLTERLGDADDDARPAIEQEITDARAKLEALFVTRTPEMRDGLSDLLRDLEAQRELMNAAREAYEAHLLARMVADDGTPADQILSLISEDDFQQLMRDDEEASVVIKTIGGDN